MTKFEFRPPRVDPSSLKSVTEDKEARLNIVINASMLKKLKQLALDKNVTLRELVTEQMIKLTNDKTNK